MGVQLYFSVRGSKLAIKLHALGRAAVFMCRTFEYCRGITRTSDTELFFGTVDIIFDRPWGDPEDNRNIGKRFALGN